MEERVAVHNSLDAPERDAERDARERDHAASAQLGPASRRRAPRERQRDRAGDEHERERHVERAVNRERDREGARDQRTRPRERSGGARAAQRACDEPSRKQEHERRRREPQPQPDAGLREQARKPEQRHSQQERWNLEPHAISSPTVPEPSHDAASRYIRPRSPRMSAPRSRSESRSRSLARLA